MVKKKTKNTARVLAFDPGLTETGYTVGEYDIDSKIITVTQFNEFKATAVAKRKAYEEQTDAFGLRSITLGILRDELDKLIKSVAPDYVVAEGIFFNPKRPTAYLALVQWMTVLEMLAVYEYEMKVFQVPTRLAKQCVTGNGGASKSSIQETLMSLDGLKFKAKLNLAELSAHQADAIAILYTFAQLALPELVKPE